MRAYFPANYQVKRGKILLSSKSQFVPTRRHTNLGCGSLQAKRCPNRAVENGKSKNNKRNCVYHPLPEQIKLNETKWNCASHPLAITNNANKIDVSHPLATSKPPTGYSKEQITPIESM